MKLFGPKAAAALIALSGLLASPAFAADTRISELPALSGSLTSTDIVPMVDVGGTCPASCTTKKATFSQIQSYIEGSIGTAAFRSLIDDADTAAMRSTLGLGYFATGTDATNLTGTVAAARLPQFTGGDVTTSGSGSVNLAIGTNKVTRSMLAQTAGAAILGATGAGNVADLTAAQAKTFLSIGTSDVSGLATVASSGSASDLSSGTLARPVAASSGTIGYTTGACGAVTQLTSKSTGVTLNKACGQITLNNASLGSTNHVTFVVTNSTVAATDTIILNLASGAADGSKYRYWISAVGSGSFSPTLENLSGGALGEAVVINYAVIKSTSS